MSTTEISRSDVTRQLQTLGVRPGDVLLTHTSFRAVRPVERGPLGLVEALLDALGPEGTLVMPSWPGDADVPFDRSSTPCDPHLGVVADTFWRQSGVLRNEHPQAFAAVGPRAEEILADPLPLPPHRHESPVGRVFDLQGQVLLLGVGHDANTTIHLAELLAGVPYRVTKHCTVVVDGVPTRVVYEENDHCCARFVLVDGWVREVGLQREGSVGHAHARLTESQDIVRVVRARLETAPLLFLHGPDAGCADCDEARTSVGASPAPMTTTAPHPRRGVGP